MRILWPTKQASSQINFFMDSPSDDIFCVVCSKIIFENLSKLYFKTTTWNNTNQCILWICLHHNTNNVNIQKSLSKRYGKFDRWSDEERTLILQKEVWFTLVYISNTFPIKWFFGHEQQNINFYFQFE